MKPNVSGSVRFSTWCSLACKCPQWHMWDHQPGLGVILGTSSCFTEHRTAGAKRVFFLFFFFKPQGNRQKKLTNFLRPQLKAKEDPTKIRYLGCALICCPSAFSPWPHSLAIHPFLLYAAHHLDIQNNRFFFDYHSVGRSEQDIEQRSNNNT